MAKKEEKENKKNSEEKQKSDNELALKIPENLPKEAQEKIKEIKEKIDKFQKEVLKKFDKYIMGIALLPPQRKGEEKPAQAQPAPARRQPADATARQPLHRGGGREAARGAGAVRPASRRHRPVQGLQRRLRLRRGGPADPGGGGRPGSLGVGSGDHPGSRAR